MRRTSCRAWSNAPFSIASFSIALIVAGLSLGNSAAAVTLVNPGFNDSTGWTLANDATLAHPGGTAPWSWDTPLVAATVVHATETVLPVEGTGMGLTYAGSDAFSQSVEFASAGSYTFSVDANAVAGTAVNDNPMVDGEFAFFVSGSSSPVQLVATTSGWETFQWSTFVSAGAHEVGLRNTLSAPYSIAYDNFLIVPEPTGGALLALSLLGFGVRRKLASHRRNRAVART